MASMRSSDARLPRRPSNPQVALPAPDIPMRRTPWFMQVLGLLAVQVLVGIAYSFSRISAAATPKVDVLRQPSTLGTTVG